MRTSLTPTGRPAPRDLANARVELHHAAQIAMSVADARLPHEDDDRQSSFHVDASLGGLVARSVDGRAAGLRFEDLSLVVVGPSAETIDAFALSGRRLSDGLAWMAKSFGTELRLRDYDMPDHPVATGAAFSGEGDTERKAARVELTRWFVAADRWLEEVRRREPSASDVLVWPHHFDVATLITLRSDRTETSTIGVGLSPGDDSYDEPYLYVTPWPYPDPSTLPPLPGLGRWHVEDFVAAVLPASELLVGRDVDGAARDFLGAAIAACRGRLETGP